MNRTCDNHFNRCATLFALVLVVVVVPTTLIAQEQKKEKPKAVATLCPETLVMQFGSFYYYDCFDLADCDVTHGHILGGNTRAHTLGCVQGSPDTCDAIPSSWFRPDKKKTIKKTKEKVKAVPHHPPSSSDPNDPDVRATIYVPHAGVTFVEKFAKYTGNDPDLRNREFRVVKVKWPISSGNMEAIMCHECINPTSIPMTLVDTNTGDVAIGTAAQGFTSGEIVEIVVRHP